MSRNYNNLTEKSPVLAALNYFHTFNNFIIGHIIEQLRQRTDIFLRAGVRKVWIKPSTGVQLCNFVCFSGSILICVM